MTELHFRNTEECINRIKSIKEMYAKDTPSEVALREAINALEEVEKYRNIGVVSADELEQDLLLYKADREVLSMYNALGTVEELKIAKEKQIPKKPYCVEDKMWCCPVCYNNLLSKWIMYNIELMPKSNGLPYCLNCGQAIDWSDTD